MRRARRASQTTSRRTTVASVVAVSRLQVLREAVEMKRDPLGHLAGSALRSAPAPRSAQPTPTPCRHFVKEICADPRRFRGSPETILTLFPSQKGSFLKRPDTRRHATGAHTARLPHRERAGGHKLQSIVPVLLTTGTVTCASASTVQSGNPRRAAPDVEPGAATRFVLGPWFRLIDLRQTLPWSRDCSVAALTLGAQPAPRISRPLSA